MIPEFAAEQLERDAVRCYNGAAGSDNLGHNYLHEYRIVLDDNGALVADVGPGQATAVARWEVVPTDDRPDVGDPDYVNHVYGRSPL